MRKIKQIFNPPGDHLKPHSPMKKISLKGGWLFCPADWIVLSPKEFKRSDFAGVIEVRNAPKGFPHFVYSTNTPPGKDFSEEEINEVTDLCIKAYPDFQKMLDAQIELIKDPAHPGQFLNLDKWKTATEVGFFHIYVDGLTPNPLGKEPPYGAKIIPKKKRTAYGDGTKQPLR